MLILWWEDTFRKIKCLIPYYPHRNLPIRGTRKIRKKFPRKISVCTALYLMKLERTSIWQILLCIICDKNLHLTDCLNLRALLCLWWNMFCKIKCRSQSDTLLSPSQSSQIGNLHHPFKRQRQTLCDGKGDDKEKDAYKDKDKACMIKKCFFSDYQRRN